MCICSYNHKKRCLVFSFIFNQAGYHLHGVKAYQSDKFLYQHFPSAAYLDATKLFKALYATVRGIVYWTPFIGTATCVGGASLAIF